MGDEVEGAVLRDRMAVGVEGRAEVVEEGGHREGDGD